MVASFLTFKCEVSRIQVAVLPEDLIHKSCRDIREFFLQKVTSIQYPPPSANSIQKASEYNNYRDDQSYGSLVHMNDFSRLAKPRARCSGSDGRYDRLTPHQSKTGKLFLGLPLPKQPSPARYCQR